ncbi:hypothetical protein BaRGS_00013100 [Batillaria attramentaria]|uniref:Coiled-coil domain-containing protein 13 n=1 Tax=Batillaria attramentaria TaxID=370345 RepID=A0ABD0L841_9CAEN
MDSGNESLKQQFQLLQEQQQKRLMMRLQRKEEKEQKNKAHTARSTTSATSSTTSATSRVGKEFGVGDNLDLKLAEGVPSNVPGYLSEELVEHLNTQIREMKDENGRLYKLLSEKDFEIKQLKKKKRDEKAAVMESQLTNETAATKIVELSKKIRELTAELESEKTRCKQFQRKCQELQLQVASGPSSDTQSIRSAFGSVISLQSQAETKEQDEVDVKALQDKLKQTESKMAEFRNQCQMLKQEIKVAHKVVAQEIGDSNVNVQALLNNASNFRGRAQQIIALQNKVEELRAQLEAQQPPSVESEMLGKVSTARRRTQDDKYRDELRRLEKERKEVQEREAAERKAMEEDYHNLKQRMEAAKARNKVLSGEVKSLKQQMQTLLQKGRNDDELIDALMKQQTQLKQMLDEANSLRTDAVRKKEEAAQQLTVKSQQDSNVVNQLKAIVADKEAKVKVLEQELEQLKKSRRQSNEGEEFFQPSTVTLPQTAVISRESTTDTIIVSSVTPPHSRQSQRAPSAQADTTSRPDSRRTAMGSSHGERPVAGELQYQCHELNTMLQAASVERDRLAELVKVVQKRLNEETQAVTDLQGELQAARRQNVELEKLLGRQGLEQGKTGRKKLSSRTSAGTAGRDALVEDTVTEPASAASGGASDDMQEILTTVEIQKDEIESLKAALQRTLQAKEEDLNLYSTTIDQTKQVFLQALRQLKQTKLQTT